MDDRETGCEKLKDNGRQRNRKRKVKRFKRKNVTTSKHYLL